MKIITDKMSIIITLAIFVLPGTLVLPIILNGVPIWEEPGMTVRMKTYLTRNVAETSTEAAFPELRTPVFDVSVDELFQSATRIVRETGWTLVEHDPVRAHLTAVVTTPLWRFKDDVLLQVSPADTGGAKLYIRSQSRVGKGDFGANNAHIQVLISQLRQLDAKIAGQ